MKNKSNESFAHKLTAGILSTVLVATTLLTGCGDVHDGGNTLGVAGDNATNYGKRVDYTYEAPTGPEASEIFVQPVEGISDDFIRGVDVSTILAQEASGVKYYNEAGEEEDIFKILADSGVNYIRVRVWNDPFDSDGNSYGGGNCNANTAADIGYRASQYGMKLLVDFHYSDFWADPNKQMCPKAWEGMSPEEKAEACYQYTCEAMDTILSQGSDVGMVQLGNETNNGMCGETKWSAIGQIMNRGRDAVLEKGAQYGKDILIAVHFTNPENNKNIDSILRKLDGAGVQYDVFALSYYPYWHGSLENLEEVMKHIVDLYGKKVMVAETSYVYTLDDWDGTGNSICEKDLNKNYAATVQSQANAVRDVFNAVNNVGDNALGVFYWEPAWVPVEVYDANDANAASVLESNKNKWEEYGSGWASSYAAEYDPGDAGRYYGGSSWDNQAMFDRNGKALPSLKVFRYLKYGTTCDLKIDFADDCVKNVTPGSELSMPTEVDVHYNDSSKNGPAPVEWNADDLAKVDTGTVGEYPVEGVLPNGQTITCTVNVANVNFVQNPSFEEPDTSMWEFVYTGDPELDFQKKETDAYSGEMAMHYWRKSDVAFKAQQTITGLDDGKYSFSLYAQGGDSGADAQMYIYAISGDNEYKQDYEVTGWCEWQHPEIAEFEVKGGEVTIGVSFEGGAGAWGTFDDFYLCKLD